ncbi:MAG TPA: YbaN family protein [Patescibacteria group bacterium]|nr:YbaN family protein [Patescibacteria group bacterium]
MSQPGGTRRVSSFRKGIFVVAGTISLGLGALGVFLPVLPTTPFLLLSAAFYYKGSERMHRWLLNNKLFGNYIKNYKEGRGIALKAKAIALCLLWTTICYSAFFIVNMIALQIVLFVIAGGVSIHILTLPTFRKPRV